MQTVVFSHGQASGPWGSKITAMADAVRAIGCHAESIDYQGLADPAERVTRLIAACADFAGPIFLVGSSMGGYVATAAAPAVNAIGLFVLAPAYYMEGFEPLTPSSPGIPTVIVHGWHDDIVPVDNSIRFARDSAATLYIVDGDHRLTTNIDDINQYLTYFVGRLMVS